MAGACAVVESTEAGESYEASVRRIAHIDMDAFYASVELLRYPELRGQPLVIGGGSHPAAPGQFSRLKDYAGRGVVTTATYPARAFGVHSAMGLMKAAKLCPEAILLPVDFAEYRRYSRRFKAIVLECAPQMEDRGIDEVFADLTEVPGGQALGGRTLAAQIQLRIQAETGLTCSIGVAPNKLLAKLASELHKPNGIAILHEADLASRIWPLACRKINGVGPKADARLKQLGVNTIGELAHCERAWLIEQFGSSYGRWLYETAWGWDDRPVVTESEPASMSRETTFERDLHAVRDRTELRALFTELCNSVASDLQRKGYVGRTVGIKLRYQDFSTATRDQTLVAYTSEAAEIRRAAGQCLKRAPLGQRLRLLGVRVSGLQRRELAADAAREAHNRESLSLF
jgi:DNA polymerase-4